MVATKLVAALEQLGLSNYEARAYAALVRSGPVTGYQLSRESGVPRSRIYEALEKLAGRGMVLVQHDEPQKYIAADYEEVLQRALADIQRSVDTVRHHCEAKVTRGDREGVWNITGRQNILAKGIAMVRAARSRLLIAGRAGDLRELEGALSTAHDRGARAAFVACGEFAPPFGHVYTHRFSPARCDHLVISVDGAEALVGETIPEELGTGAWSRNPGFVRVTEEYILHEVFIARALDAIDPSALPRLEALYREVMEGGKAEARR